MDINYDTLKKVLDSQGVVAGAGGGTQPMMTATGAGTEDKILQYMGKFNDLMRTANDMLGNISQLKNNPALQEMTGRVMAAKNITPQNQQMTSNDQHKDVKQVVETMTAEKVYSDIMEMISMVTNGHGNMTLNEAAVFMEANKIIVIGFLKGKGYT